MIDLMIGDLTKEMTEAKTTEKDSQSDSEQNHGKITETNMVIIMGIFGNFMVQLYLNNIFNGLIGFSRFGLV